MQLILKEKIKNNFREKQFSLKKLDFMLTQLSLNTEPDPEGSRSNTDPDPQQCLNPVF